MKTLIIIGIVLILLLNPVSAFNKDYCGRFSLNRDCICRDNQNKMSVWVKAHPDCPEGKICLDYFIFGYAYCEREGKEVRDARIASLIYNLKGGIK